MCGIIGYIGDKQAVPILMKGLSRLEYRGYDSAGIAILSNGAIKVKKKAGKLNLLADSIKNNTPPATVGIGHTRWATHGLPNETNAHPHTDCSGTIAIVHNGIIENYFLLKKKLLAQGHRFRSQTDTEVISHLIEKFYKGSLEDALRKAAAKLIGSFAICAISKKEPNKIFGIRRHSPLIVAIGQKENFIASDIPAILDYTREVIYLNDEEVVSLTKTDVRLSDMSGKVLEKKTHQVDWDISQAEKSGFSHFMLKEIHEQPQAIHNTMAGRLSSSKDAITFNPKIKELLDRYVLKNKNFKNIIIVSCGTAYHAGMVGEYLLEEFANISVDVDLSSEFRYRQPQVDGNNLVIAVSQSGETADTLAAVRIAKKRGAKVLSICNVVGSSLARESDAIIYTQAGPEIAVASTKAYTSQLVTFVLLAVYMGLANRYLRKTRARELLGQLSNLPKLVEGLLIKKPTKEIIDDCIKRYQDTHYFLYLGRNINYPTALEGALKLKEICYISAEGYAAGEMKHGPIALAREGFPVIAIATKSRVYEKMLSNIEEIRARKGDVIAIATEGDSTIKAHCDFVMYVPDVDEALSPILSVIPLQLLAYYLAVELGNDVDKPRNLAKSVTVE